MKMKQQHQKAQSIARTATTVGSVAVISSTSAVASNSLNFKICRLSPFKDTGELQTASNLFVCRLCLTGCELSMIDCIPPRRPTTKPGFERRSCRWSNKSIGLIIPLQRRTLRSCTPEGEARTV